MNNLNNRPKLTGKLKSEPAREVTIVSTRLKASDIWGGWKARWTMGRMDYTVKPGLYGVGQPDVDSPVLVTANYKLTFDHLRSELDHVNAWILVLDTKGINVWCAAGKGTFGTDELVRRIKATRLDNRVSHRVLIVPQLGATGIAAHKVAAATGFQVVYGPVRAEDLPAFLAAGQIANSAMRQVRFNTMDRLILTPAEFVFTFKPAAIILGVMFIFNTLGLGHYGMIDLYALAGTIVIGCILVPILLPLIPGRAFSFKGALMGVLWAIGIALLNGWLVGFSSTLPLLKAMAYLLLIPSLSGYLAMNFTGSSTYTSPSGVNREMKLALPIMLIATILGVIMLLLSDIEQLFV